MMRQKWTVALVLALIASLAGFASPAQAVEWSASELTLTFDPAASERDEDWVGVYGPLNPDTSTGGCEARVETTAGGEWFGQGQWTVSRTYTKVGDPDPLQRTMTYRAGGEFSLTASGGGTSFGRARSKSYPDEDLFPGATVAEGDIQGHQPNGTSNNGYGPANTTLNFTLAHGVEMKGVTWARADATITEEMGGGTANVHAWATFKWPPVQEE